MKGVPGAEWDQVRSIEQPGKSVQDERSLIQVGLEFAKRKHSSHQTQEDIENMHDLAPKPIRTSRVLDLGCLDGIYSLDCVLHEADVIGIDAYKANVQKALFAKEA